MKEHPDDKKLRLESERWAKVAVKSFFLHNQEEFIELVQTYSDAKAATLLEKLREKFWSQSQETP